MPIIMLTPRRGRRSHRRLEMGADDYLASRSTRGIAGPDQRGVAPPGLGPDAQLRQWATALAFLGWQIDFSCASCATRGARVAIQRRIRPVQTFCERQAGCCRRQPARSTQGRNTAPSNQHRLLVSRIRRKIETDPWNHHDQDGAFRGYMFTLGGCGDDPTTRIMKRLGFLNLRGISGRSRHWWSPRSSHPPDPTATFLIHRPDQPSSIDRGMRCSSHRSSFSRGTSGRRPALRRHCAGISATDIESLRRVRCRANKRMALTCTVCVAAWQRLPDRFAPQQDDTHKVGIALPDGR